MTFKFKNLDEIYAAIHDVRNDESETNWVLTGYSEGGVSEVELKGTGSGGTEEMCQSIELNNCYYGLVRVMEVIDESETIKFCFIKFLGNKMKPLWRARLTTHYGQVQAVFKPYHVDLFAETHDEISHEAIVDLVSEASMSKSKVKENSSKSNSAGRESELHALRPRMVNSYVDGAIGGSKTKEKSYTTSSSIQKESSSANSSKLSKKSEKYVDFQNKEEIIHAIKSVRDDNTDTNWMLTGYCTENLKVIGLLGKGSNGIEELKQHISDDSVFYGMVRIEDVIDDSVTIKFAFIHFQGSELKPLAKARLSTHKGNVVELFEPFHVSFFASHIDELQNDEIEKMVQNASFSASHVLPSKGEISKPVESTKPKKTFQQSRTGRSNAQFEFDNLQEIKEALGDVRSDESETNWALLGYAPDSKTKVQLIGTGSGGADELKTLLKDNSAYYGIVRSTEVIDDSVTVKFAFVHFLGDNTPPMLKARISTHKGTLEDLLNPCHVSLFATETDEISQEIIETLVAKASMKFDNVRATK